MNTLKIVVSGEGKGTKTHFFSGFKHLIMARGVFKFKEGLGVLAIEDGDKLSHKLDKIIALDSEIKGDINCKIFTLDMGGDNFMTIGTPSRAFLLGDNGKTIEAMY